MNRLLLIFMFVCLAPSSAPAQCVMPSGPPAEAGVIIFNDDHKVMQYCNGDKWIGLWGGKSGGGSTPTGAVIAFDLSACPEGWSEYAPARGRFIRGLDNGAGNDPDGARTAGHIQEDALQNITGTFGGNNIEPTGAFSNLGTSQTSWGGSGGGRRWALDFNASRVARTSNETRPKNVALLYCRKN